MRAPFLLSRNGDVWYDIGMNETTPALTKRQKRRHLLTYVKYMCPSLFDLSVYSLCTMVSGSMTSKWVSATAMGAVSVASPFISIVYAYALIFGVGGATVISLYHGKGDRDSANKAFTMDLTFMMLTTLLIGLAAFVFAAPLADLLGATPENAAYVVQYLRVTTLFALPYGLCYTLSLLIKADGRPLLGLIGSVAGSGTTLLLLNILLRFTDLGVTGAALASASGQLVICVIYFLHFLTPRATLKFVRFRFSVREMLRIVSIGAPDAISEGSSGIFVLLFNYIVFRRLGENGVIVFSVINYMNLLTVQMTLGVTQGMQPLVSFAHGKGDAALETLYRLFARLFAGGIGLVMFAVCMLLTKTVVRQFIDPASADTFAMGVRALRTYAWFLPLVGISLVSIGYFSAVEQQRKSQLLSLFRGIFGIALFALTLPLLLGEVGIWLSPAVTEAVTAAAAVLLFLRERKRPPLPRIAD